MLCRALSGIMSSSTSDLLDQVLLKILDLCDEYQEAMKDVSCDFSKV